MTQTEVLGMRKACPTWVLVWMAGCGGIVPGRVFPRDAVEAGDGQEVAEASDLGGEAVDPGPGDRMGADGGDTVQDAVETGAEAVDGLEVMEVLDVQEVWEDGGGVDPGRDGGPPVGPVRHVGWFGPGGSGSGPGVRGMGWFSGFGHAWRR